MKRSTLLLCSVLQMVDLCLCKAFVPPNKGTGISSFGHHLPPSDGSPLSLRGGFHKHSLAVMKATRGGAKAKTKLIKKRRRVDWSALFKYGTSLSLQLSLIFGFFSLLDKVLARTSVQLPFVVNIVFFYFFNAKTGTFSPLKQQRDTDTSTDDGFAENKVRPKWTPPGIVFAIMWPIFVFGIRATTASMVVEFCGARYATAPLMSLFAHLAFGNLWNSV